MPGNDLSSEQPESELIVAPQIRWRTNHSSPAFTLIELLTVIAIIGLLVALLLPAVQASRESSRRLQCANNLKQLGLGILNYESAHGELPRCGIVNPRRDDLNLVDIYNPYSGKQLSWIVLVLPFVEQQDLYAKFDINVSIDRQINNPQQQIVSMLLCPSDEALGKYYELLRAGIGLNYVKVAKGNYAAYVSPFHVDLQYLYPGALLGIPQTSGKIVDGFSRTLALSEVRTLDHPYDERGAWALAWNGASLLAFDMHPESINGDPNGSGEGDPYIRENLAPYKGSSESLGETQRPNNQGPNLDTLKQCAETYDDLPSKAAQEQMPCSLHIGAFGKIGVEGHYSAAPRSLHPGGVNATFLDGHVVFLVNEIDEFTMAYMVSSVDEQQ
ncbi:DUF1559 domain-containing protein [Bythopirellula polymerisocia]|uniref:DUF1559 domain-containing protein n=1 Tax=Bythopirellula polymerisocia TaxID=2528003 RepID=A0A5C6CJQ6_9BACT|nr:DUF1559 domain-containing protein [Bythopirellula polymerisocia]TWU24688.1 hypothetical protein Pla144_35740 [Bythopirellula polymerisocia]